MITLNLTDYEFKMMKQFLSDHANYLGNQCCDDVDFPLTLDINERKSLIAKMFPDIDEEKLTEMANRQTVKYISGMWLCYHILEKIKETEGNT